MSAPISVPDPGDLSARRWLGGVSLPLPKVGEERLARLAGDGNARAFGVLYERYHQILYRYCHSLVRNDSDAQDALQSTFAAALAALQRGQRDAPLRPWLFRIAHNESVSMLRRRRPDEALSDAIESTAPSVEHSAEERARLASLVADLADLPERQRGALLMRELSGLSHEEIASALAVSVGSAKQTIFEARRSLTEFAEGRAMACDEIQRLISDGDGRALRARRVRAHLRDCSGCAAFATAIPARETDLRALSPALPIAAASGLLARVTSASSGHGGSTTGVVASATGKAATAAVSLKVATAGVVIVAAAGAGAAGALHATPGSQPQSSTSHGARAAHQQAAPHTAGPGAAPAGQGASTGLLVRRGAAGATGIRVSAGLATHGGAAGHSNAPGLRGNSGSAAGHGGAATAAAGHRGSSANPGAHRGTTNHPSATNHPGATNHLGATNHPSATNHPRGGSPTHAHAPATRSAASQGHSSSSGTGGSAHPNTGKSSTGATVNQLASQAAGRPTTVPTAPPPAVPGSGVTTPAPVHGAEK